MKTNLITLTTDFGNDAFATAQLKGVIYSLNREARITECASYIESFSITAGAFILREISRFFPYAIHVAVVDPGVGTSRKPLLFETTKGFFIGPDNGLLLPAALESGLVEVFEIDVSKLGNPKISNTFHGRDIFAWTAGLLSTGIDKSEVVKHGVAIADINQHSILHGEIVFIDPYGNIKINNPAQYEIGQKLQFKVGQSEQELSARFVKTFADVAVGEPLFYLGSNWNLELAINLGSAAKEFGLTVGDIIEISESEDLPAFNKGKEVSIMEHVWHIENRSFSNGCDGVATVTPCSCGKELVASITGFARTATARCECGISVTVPSEVVVKAATRRMDDLHNAAAFRAQHSGSGLLIPDC